MNFLLIHCSAYIFWLLKLRFLFEFGSNIYLVGIQLTIIFAFIFLLSIMIAYCSHLVLPGYVFVSLWCHIT